MTPNDPFSAYRVNKPQEPVFQETPSIKMDSEDPFSQFRMKDSEISEESWPQYLKRNATRLGSRVIETIGGIPGEVEQIGNLIQSGTFDFLEKIGPKSKVPREELVKRRLPTSSELKEKSIELTGGYTAPKDEPEKMADEFASTVSSLLGPMKFRKALGIAALGTAARKGTEVLGLGETSQEAAKLGTMLVSSMINPKGVKQLYTNLYNEAENLVPQGTSVPSKKMEENLYKLRDKLSAGIEAPSEKAVIDDIDRVLAKVKDGRVQVNEMMATNRSINEKMGDPELLKRGKNLYPQLKKEINNVINSYDKPDFLKAWNGANESFGALHESQKISRFIQKNIGNKPVAGTIIAGLAETAGGHPEFVLPTIGASIVGAGAVKGIELMKRIISSPILRKYYGEVILNASKENSRAMISSYEKLENEINRHQNLKNKPK